ncbi:unnamed protein product, partial [Symbiodinium sp. CCMP2456]
RVPPFWTQRNLNGVRCRFLACGDLVIARIKVLQGTSSHPGRGAGHPPHDA